MPLGSACAILMTLQGGSSPGFGVPRARFGANANEDADMATMHGLMARQFLQACHVEFQEVPHPRAVSAQRLAHEEHETGWRVAKPVMLKVGRDIVMAVVPAPLQVDLIKVKMALGRNDVTLAREDEFAALFPDCEVGAEPPIGNPYGFPMYLERSLRLDPYLVFRDGTHEGTLKVDTNEFLRATRPVEIDIGSLRSVPSIDGDPMADDIS